MLCYNSAGAEALIFAHFGPGLVPIHLDDVMCFGSEQNILDCPHSTTHNCAHYEDAGVRCQGCATGEIRLVGGTGTFEGRVEFCRNGVWGTVCDDMWDDNDATVVCRELGFSAVGAMNRTSAYFGQGTGTVFITDVQCVGTESQLEDCPYTTQNSCTHSEDAGVVCVATRKFVIYIDTLKLCCYTIQCCKNYNCSR